MDGAEPATPNIGASQEFTYRFSVQDAGTYWAHPHTGLDGDKGLYLPVIIDNPTEHISYDAEWIVVLDDWTDGVGKTPQQLYNELTNPNKPSTTTTTTTTATTTTPTTSGTSETTSTSPTTTTTSASTMPGMPGEVGASDLLGGDAGDISYPTIWSTGEFPRPRRPSTQNRASESGFGSSTPVPTPRFASLWPVIR